MSALTRRQVLGSLLTLPALSIAEESWTPLFNGRNLDGWKAGGAPDSFHVADGMIAVDGPRAHLFYTGPVRNADFKNFVVKTEVMTRPACNSGFYFHTRYRASGFPDNGFEVQVNNTATGEGTYRERKKTASLYGVRDVYKQFVPDNEWFRLQIAVRGKRVQIHLNDMLMVDYIEPVEPIREGVKTGRILDRGTFALQCHDETSKAFFRNIMVAPLPDDLPEAPNRPVVDQNFRDILYLNAHNYPVVDYHVHLKGITLEEALAESRRLGIAYGIAVNCGVGFPTTDDASAEAFLNSMKGQPVFIGMQAEGREWTRMFSKSTIARFDYVFTDAMTFTNDDGKRVRLWIKEETGEIGDKQKFMDMLVDRIIRVLNEPIDIYVNPTFLPDVIAAEYDHLWTPERMDRVIAEAKKNGIAIEINNRYKIPSAAFIKRAKAAGVKFSFGTNNADRNLGRIEYSIAMVKECKLDWQDIFVPAKRL